MEMLSSRHEEPGQSRRWRRQVPRIETKAPVVILTRNSKVAKVSGVVRDVSPEGIRLELSRVNAQAIHPSGKFITEENAPWVAIRTRLPGIDGYIDVTAQCRATYFELVADNGVAFGFEFSRLTSENSTALWRFIEQSLIPAA